MQTQFTTSTVNEAAVLQALRVVMDPDLHKNIVELGFVKNIKICEDTVAFDVELTTPACPVKNLLRDQAINAVKALPGVTTVNVNMTAQVRKATPTAAKQHDKINAIDGLENVKNIIAIASGKGGVGKSTVAANLAIALAKTGASVGLMDADVYGPSVPKLMGGDARPDIVERADGAQILKPLERYGIKFISMGLLTGPQTPVIWRGPMATKLVQQFLSQVDWGNLDYLLVDLPPGTGDVQLTLTQAAPLNGAVVVTTPQELAVGVTLRGLKMFEQVRVPILGIVENMSGFACPHCHEVTSVFQKDGGKNAAAELGVPFLGAIPLHQEIASAADAGAPLTTQQTSAELQQLFSEIAGRVAQQVSLVNEKTASTTFQVKEVMSKDGIVRLVWNDGHESLIPNRTLRLKCPCARCIDEWTGKPLLDASSVKDDIYVIECSHVGRYALQFHWSDGHRTGIYPYDKLRQLDPTAPL